MRKQLLGIPALFLALGLAACGGDDGGGNGGSNAAADEDQQLEFVECMRDNGVDMPDPEPGEEGHGIKMPAQSDDPEAEEAMEECKDLMPDSGQPAEPSEEDLENLQAYTDCMRDNGVDDMPDPNPNGALTMPEDLDPDSSTFTDANEECKDEIEGGSVTIEQESP